MTREEFKTCFDQYFDPLRNYLYYRSGDAELATDISQEAFMKIWEKQFDYHPTKTKSLLYKIGIDLFLSHLRKNKVADAYVESLAFDIKKDSPETTFEFQELKENYEKALSNLPEKQRSVFLMSRKDGLTYKDIAERLDISVKAIEKRMSLALATLKKQLGHYAK